MKADLALARQALLCLALEVPLRVHADVRFKIEPCLKELESLRALVDRIDQTLRVPAAEYVPAIGDVFKLIDEHRKAGEK